jgi:hypothetical protein
MENRVMCRLFINQASASQKKKKKVPTGHIHINVIESAARFRSLTISQSPPTRNYISLSVIPSPKPVLCATRMPVEFIFQALIMACDNFLLFSSSEGLEQQRARRASSFRRLSAISTLFFSFRLLTLMRTNCGLCQPNHIQ